MSRISRKYYGTYGKWQKTTYSTEDNLSNKKEKISQKRFEKLPAVEILYWFIWNLDKPDCWHVFSQCLNIGILFRVTIIQIKVYYWVTFELNHYKLESIRAIIRNYYLNYLVVSRMHYKQSAFMKTFLQRTQPTNIFGYPNLKHRNIIPIS